MKAEYNAFLLRLSTLSSADRAALKRSAGVMLADADGASISAFYRCLPHGVPAWQEERWFAIACLRCLWDAEPEGENIFEIVVGQLITEDVLSGSTQHRVEVLLDTAWDEDGYMLTKLTRLFKLIRQKSDRASLNFPALLDDLLHWNDKNQYVQRKWARAIFVISEN